MKRINGNPGNGGVFGGAVARRAGALFLTAGLVVGLACSVNPATGEREFNIVSEAQEIAMGREADPQIVAQFGLYPDDDLQEHVQRLGAELAAQSERPDLPWTFRVLDDPLVNAFALPGGFIYVTRGIMTHLNSEAELVGVLGHEIGHVTARHGATRQSKGILAQIGLVAGAILAPEAAQSYGGLAQQVTQLLFLRYGRQDELEADRLGLRYAAGGGYDPNALIGVFETLGRVGEASGRSPLPNWASTHPAPENRQTAMRQQIAATALPAGLQVRRDPYLRSLEDMKFGEDARQGFFVDDRFYHPDLRFQMALPDGWTHVNTRQRVASLNPERDTMVELRLAPGDSVQEAGEAFFRQQGVVATRNWGRGLDGFDAVDRPFEVRDQTGRAQLEGIVYFVEHRDVVLQLLGYGKTGQSRSRWRTVDAALRSFSRLDDRRILGVEPMRIDIVEVRRGDSWSDLARRSSVDAATLELINRSADGEALRAGSLVKVVRGFNPANGLPR